jgi:hypothetical protein
MTNNDTYLTVYATNFINYTTCFGPNGPSSDVSLYQLIELQRELHIFSFTYVHIWLLSFSLPPYLGILTSVGLLYLSVSKLIAL